MLLYWAWLTEVNIRCLMENSHKDERRLPETDWYLNVERLFCIAIVFSRVEELRCGVLLGR